MASSIVTKNEQETIKFAKNFLEDILKEANRGKPLIFYLTGELGAGKTHFVKGLAQALGIKDNITSPTFVLVKKYIIPKGLAIFFHIDCYRIYDSEDARQIGLDKVLQSPKAIIAVEWAERIEDIIPRPYWKVKMEHAGGRERRISVKKLS